MDNLPYLALAAAPERIDPMQLFLDADLVVQAVIIGLVLASIWVWMIIVSFSLRIGRLRSRTVHFEEDFWDTEDFDNFVKEKRRKDLPAARVANAGMAEWRRSTANKPVDREGTRQRIASAMESQVAAEADELAERLNFLATVGSVAPFVGLFGTVWGIMNSFFSIGLQESSSLAVVAPGISEALFATAIGLFAAIPAVIAYNRFSHKVNRLEARMQRFADRLHASLSRQLEVAG
ncbi:protein TolQ [Qipengyuania oceanensis]|uniref:Protein TolQ n=1 Tax=Qipengyuania oceanensis TaxID=1463597 RepID=A0A844YJB5_9SPHN|nr:protein TolQ [Qipengyuania oceanensis]MXO64047.1 protein TolQ [Qipengyuania oceanensis]